MKMFDDYLGYRFLTRIIRKCSCPYSGKKKRGVRVNALHVLVNAAMAVTDAMRDQNGLLPTQPIGLNPWFKNFGAFDINSPNHDYSSRYHPGTLWFSG